MYHMTSDYIVIPYSIDPRRSLRGSRTFYEGKKEQHQNLDLPLDRNFTLEVET